VVRSVMFWEVRSVAIWAYLSWMLDIDRRMGEHV
jgi:hypothetical protein